MDVTLGLVLTMSSRKEWPRTCIAVQYPPGHSEQVVKHGQTDRGIQRYLGQNTACVQGRFFLAYRHRGCGPAVKPTSLALRRNASGLRDTARGLRSRTDTGWSDLKKKDAALALVNAARLRTIHPEEMTVAMARAGEAEMQERWSCVGHKGPPRGPWHALEHHTGAVLAYVFGRHKAAVFGQRQARLEPCGLTRFSPDYWGAYPRHLEPDAPSPGKRNTEPIERPHLTLRTRIKRWVRQTIGCSKTTQMHDLVIGLFVNRSACGRAV